MSATVFYVGGAELATLSNVFSVLGAPTDPTAATLVVTDPAGAVTTYNWPGGPNTLTHPGTGAFTQNQPCSTVPGLWQYVWTGTGTASDIAQGTWTVLPLTAGQYYCSAEELKSRMGLPATDSADDFEFQLAVQAAARSIEGYCGRYFWQAPDTRTYVPEDMWVLHTDDLVSVTTLKTDQDGDGVFETTWAGTDYALAAGERSYNVNASGEARPYREIRAVTSGKFFPFVWALTHQDRIQVVGVFGWPAVPPTVKQAALQLASNYFKMKDAPFGVQGMSEFGVIRVQAFPQVTQMLQPYVDPRRKVGV